MNKEIEEAKEKIHKLKHEEKQSFPEEDFGMFKWRTRMVEMGEIPAILSDIRQQEKIKKENLRKYNIKETKKELEKTKQELNTYQEEYKKLLEELEKLKSEAKDFEKEKQNIATMKKQTEEMRKKIKELKNTFKIELIDGLFDIEINFKPEYWTHIEEREEGHIKNLKDEIMVERRKKQENEKALKMTKKRYDEAKEIIKKYEKEVGDLEDKIKTIKNESKEDTKQIKEIKDEINKTIENMINSLQEKIEQNK